MSTADMLKDMPDHHGNRAHDFWNVIGQANLSTCGYRLNFSTGVGELREQLLNCMVCRLGENTIQLIINVRVSLCKNMDPISSLGHWIYF